MLVTIGLGLLAVVAVLLVVIALRPAAFRIERSTKIAAPAEVIYAQLEDLHAWSAWNPFEKGDPGMRKTFEGAPSGVGAGFHFAGKKTGEGRMTLTELAPPTRVAVRAEFIKPMAAVNRIEFTLTPVADRVSVTWMMSGDHSFMGKAFAFFVDLDRMMGPEFERGLADLKRVSEAAAEARSPMGRHGI